MNPNRLSRSSSILIATLWLFVIATVSAETLSPGDAFPQISGQDQHEKAYSTQSARLILISFDMGPGKKANAFFEEKGASYLPEHEAVFVANIHGMPGVGRFFAIPKMQKYPHRILLADEKGLLDPFPQEKGKLTVLTLDQQGAIRDISFWDPDSGSEPF